MRRATKVLILAAIVALVALPAQAALVSFANRISWSIAAGPTTNIDFEGIAPDGGLQDFTVPGLDLAGWHFDSYGNGPGQQPKYLLVVDDTYPNISCGYACYDWGSGAVLHGPPAVFPGNPAYGDTAPAGLVATFGTGASAVGTDLWSILPDAGFFDVFVTLADTNTYQYTNVATPSRATGRGFVGFTSDIPIVELRFEPKKVVGVGGGPYVDLDNFAFQPVPEPGTLLLLGTGLLGLSRSLRGRSRSRRD